MSETSNNGLAKKLGAMKRILWFKLIKSKSAGIIAHNLLLCWSIQKSMVFYGQ